MTSNALLKRRRTTLTDSIPSEYQRVTWVGPNNIDVKAHIDTGFCPNQDTRVLMGYRQTITNSYPARYGTEEPRFTLLPKRCDYNTTQTFTIPTQSLNVDYFIDHNKNYITINGTQYGPIAAYEEFTCPNTLYLWSLNGYDQKTVRFAGKTYYFKMYDNGTLIADYVPCYRKSDGIIGFYDRVSKQFLTTEVANSNLSKGEDVL